MHQLYALLSEPTLFEKSTTNFWDDEHISEQLLSAHLDASVDGASRGPAFMDASASWIASIAPPERYGALLDLGCGPGLYATRFAAMGYRVTGVDFSRRSIRYASANARPGIGMPLYVYANYLDIDYREEFDLVVLIYCDYGALSPEDGAALLRKIHAALRPGGKLVFDVFTTNRHAAFRERRVWDFHPRGGFWRPDSHFTITDDRKYDARVTLEQTVVVSKDDAVAHYVWHRYFTREDVENEALAAGFTTTRLYSDAAGAQYDPTSETMAAILEKP